MSDTIRDTGNHPGICFDDYQPRRRRLWPWLLACALAVALVEVLR